jgi:hypothetical protein
MNIQKPDKNKDYSVEKPCKQFSILTFCLCGEIVKRYLAFYRRTKNLE